MTSAEMREQLDCSPMWTQRRAVNGSRAMGGVAVRLLCLLLSVAGTGGDLHAAPPLSTSGMLAKGVGLSLHGQDPTRPAALVQIEQVKLGAQRRGFFRVAALPLIVAEGVAVRFRVADATALIDLPQTFATIARTDTLELRRVAWFAPGEESPLLRAELVEVDGPGAWKLTGLEWADGTRWPTARLILSGREAGTLSDPSNRSVPPRLLFSQSTKP